MTQIERRLASIEKRLRNLEARGIVTRENSKQFGSDHAGKKTKEVIAQEMKSLLNQYNPDTMTQEEKRNYSDEFKKILEEANHLNESDKKWVESQISNFKEKIAGLFVNDI